MGGASSAMADQLKDEMDEAFLRDLMKENFDPIMFKTLKDEDGNVAKDLLLSVISKGAEREVYLLFMGYSPSGSMDAETYMQMCSNTKLLNKALTRTEAGDIFKKSLFRRNIQGDEVTYCIFRDGVLPDFADERHVDVESILSKLARFDPPDSLEVEREYDRLSSLQMDAKQHDAALKLQKVTRGKNARRKAQATLKAQKTCRDLAGQTREKVQLRRMNTMDETEFMRRLFESYCKPPHELSAKGFKMLCRDSNFFDKNFLPIDSEIAFSQVLAEISTLDRLDLLHQHIIFDKRIEFPIFIMFLIPEVADLKQCSVENVIAAFSDAFRSKKAAVSHVEDDPTSSCAS